MCALLAVTKTSGLCIINPGAHSESLVAGMHDSGTFPFPNFPSNTARDHAKEIIRTHIALFLVSR